MRCDIETCSKKTCLEQGMCYEFFFNRKTKTVHPPKKKKQKPEPVLVKAAKPVRFSELYPFFKDGSMCELPGHRCNKIDSCKILGQCILNHPLVKGNPEWEKKYKSKLSIQAMVKRMTEQMPQLDRLSNPLYKKPEWLLKWLNRSGRLKKNPPA